MIYLNVYRCTQIIFFSVLLVVVILLGACKSEKKRIRFYVDSPPAKDSQKLPLNLCIEAHLQEIGTIPETEKFCNCYVPKFAGLLAQDTALLNLASRGELDKIPTEKKIQLLEFYQSCFSVEDIQQQLAEEGFSPEVLDGIRRGIKGALTTTNASDVIHIDKFCDCMIAEIPKRYKLLEVMRGNMLESKSYKALQDSCILANKK